MTRPQTRTLLDELGTRARNALRFTCGAPLFASQHVLRLRHIERTERTVDDPTWPLPPDGAQTTGLPVQGRDAGCGPIVVRRYEVDVSGASATELVDALRADPNAFVPRHIAGFRTGDSGGAEVRDLDLGDEILIEIPGPWNGPVRVDAVDDSSFTLVTLDGHMEAGHIRFAVEPATADEPAQDRQSNTDEPGDADDDATVTFSITSWARAGDKAFEQVHLRVRVAAELQLAMWAHTCDRVVERSGGRRCSPIRVTTEILEGTEL